MDRCAQCHCNLCCDKIYVGAQDGQKFMGVILLSLFLVNGQSTGQAVQMPVWIMALCSVIMGVGTSIGGKKDHCWKKCTRMNMTQTLKSMK